jgi:hypothetical protein
LPTGFALNLVAVLLLTFLFGVVVEETAALREAFASSGILKGVKVSGAGAKLPGKMGEKRCAAVMALSN